MLLKSSGRRGEKIYIKLYFEYRFMKHNLRNLSYITGKLDSGNICPACPQVLQFHPGVSYSFRVVV